MKSDVLLTGFEPFGGDPRNPSSEACALLDGSDIRGYRVRTLCLPTAFNAAAMQLLREITRNPPALVIATGVAGGRAEITPERFAMNFSDARIPDNRRRQPRERTIVRGAPLAYMSTLPVTRIVENPGKRRVDEDVVIYLPVKKILRVHPCRLPKGHKDFTGEPCGTSKKRAATKSSAKSAAKSRSH